MHNDEPNKIVATKRNAPLVVAVGEKEFYVASDVPAFIKHTKKAIYLADNQVVTLTPESIKLEDENELEIVPKVELSLGSRLR